MDRVLFVATYGDFLATFQLDNINLWQELGCEVQCAADFSDDKYNRYTERLDMIGIKRHQIDFLRTPYSVKNINAYIQLKTVMREEKITIVDSHNPVSSIISRLAANRVGISKVIYTVHGFFFYKGAPLLKHLIYKPVEYVMAFLTDMLIVTNEEDYEAAKKMHVRNSVHHVHGVGVDVDDIATMRINVRQKREEFGIPEDAFVVCSIGECIKRKNQESSLRAFSKVANSNMYYVIVGDGELYYHLRQLSKELGIEEQVIMPGYRKDASEILKASDLYIFPSFQEGLSVALMQAMAAELPVIASDIRGNVDCIENGKGGITIRPDDIDGMSKAILKIHDDRELAYKYGKYNSIKVKEFSKTVVRNENTHIFASLI